MVKCRYNSWTKNTYVKENVMWEKTRLKRGALSVTLALGLVLTSFNPLGVFAKEAGGEQTTAFSESRVLADAGAKELTWKDSYRLDRTVMQDGNVIQNGSNEPTGIIRCQIHGKWYRAYS